MLWAYFPVGKNKYFRKDCSNDERGKVYQNINHYSSEMHFSCKMSRAVYSDHVQNTSNQVYKSETECQLLSHYVQEWQLSRTTQQKLFLTSTVLTGIGNKSLVMKLLISVLETIHLAKTQITAYRIINMKLSFLLFVRAFVTVMYKTSPCCTFLFSQHSIINIICIFLHTYLLLTGINTSYIYHVLIDTSTYVCKSVGGQIN